MTCQSVQDQLPLWVEGELSAGEAAAVTAHLDQCQACRGAAQALRTSQAWLKEMPAAPFDATDRALLRRAVLDRIQAQAPRKGGQSWRWPLLLAAGTLLLLVPSLRPRPSVLPAPRSEPVLPQADPAPQPVAQLADPAPTQVLSAQSRPRPTPRLAQAQQEPTITRIELQTDNPQIRIIWLARAQAGTTDGSANPL